MNFRGAPVNKRHPVNSPTYKETRFPNPSNRYVQIKLGLVQDIEIFLLLLLVLFQPIIVKFSLYILQQHYSSIICLCNSSSKVGLLIPYHRASKYDTISNLTGCLQDNETRQNYGGKCRYQRTVIVLLLQNDLFCDSKYVRHWISQWLSKIALYIMSDLLE